MVSDDDVEIEVSKLSRTLTRDGFEFDIENYRIKGSTKGWSLEVVDEERASTVWDDLFETDGVALDEATRTFEEEGVAVFLRPPDHELH